MLKKFLSFPLLISHINLNISNTSSIYLIIKADFIGLIRRLFIYSFSSVIHSSSLKISTALLFFIDFKQDEYMTASYINHQK